LRRDKTQAQKPAVLIFSPAAKNHSRYFAPRQGSGAKTCRFDIFACGEKS
jgi:hypothetical protein